LPASALRENLEQIHMLTKSAQAEMRTLLLELRPSALYGTPLSDLLKHLTEAFSSRVGRPIALSIAEQRTLPPDVRVVVLIFIAYPRIILACVLCTSAPRASAPSFI